MATGGPAGATFRRWSPRLARNQFRASPVHASGVRATEESVFGFRAPWWRASLGMRPGIIVDATTADRDRLEGIIAARNSPSPMWGLVTFSVSTCQERQPGP